MGSWTDPLPPVHAPFVTHQEAAPVPCLRRGGLACSVGPELVPSAGVLTCVGVSANPPKQEAEMAVVMVRPRRKKGKKVTSTGTGQFSLRPRLARLIPHNAMFEPEITEDGILYRFVGLKGQAKKVQEPMPEAEWLNADGKRGERGTSADKLLAVTDDELDAVQRMRQQSQANYAKAQG